MTIDTVAHESRSWPDFAIVDQALFGAKASLGAFKLVAALCVFKNHKTGRCDPSEERLSELMGCSIRQVERWVSDARKAGLIEVTARRRRTNSYWILDDSRGADSAPQVDKSAQVPDKSDGYYPTNLTGEHLSTANLNPEVIQVPQPQLRVRHYSPERTTEAKRIIRRSDIDHARMDQDDFGQLMLTVCALREDRVTEAMIGAELDCIVADETEFGYLQLETILDRLEELREAS